MAKETFKDIPGYEGRYQVSDCGRVRGVKSGVLKKPRLNTKGYWHLNLKKYGKKKSWEIHKLVAITFLGYEMDGDGATCVDHIDNNPDNNALSNLQIVSRRVNLTKENRNGTGYPGVSYEMGRNKNCRTKPYAAKICKNKKVYYLGHFKTAYEAYKAREEAYHKLKEEEAT